jgi:hypothetical protein
MSSYSEYLNRQKQRLPNYIDTRPQKQDASWYTTNVKRSAAAGTLESLTPARAGVVVLNGPSTQVTSMYGKAHTVQDASMYNEYTAGQEYIQSRKSGNVKPPQIQGVCYSSDVIREKQNTLTLYPQEALKQAAKNNLGGCCRLCGEPAQFTTACPCSLTAAQQAALKDAKRRFTTPS